ncbi:MAG: hypothetical protein ACT4OE_00450 [Sphingosinicella sp.]
MPAAPATAQNLPTLISAETPAATNRHRLTEGDLRFPRTPARAGVSVTVPLRPNLDIGVGSFVIPEPARRRSNVERERPATRPRERGIAAVGVTIRF